jgi:hypothetical protein
LDTSIDNGSTPSGGKKKKSNGQRQKWSVEENLAYVYSFSIFLINLFFSIEEGMRRYAPGKWAEIKADPEFRETVSVFVEYIIRVLTFLSFSSSRTGAM